MITLNESIILDIDEIYEWRCSCVVYVHTGLESLIVREKHGVGEFNCKRKTGR